MIALGDRVTDRVGGASGRLTLIGDPAWEGGPAWVNFVDDTGALHAMSEVRLVDREFTPRPEPYQMPFVQSDGGRAATGRKGDAGDCVTRAIAIATATPYGEVYDALAEGMARRRGRHRTNGKRSARDGVFRSVYEPYLASIGWEWVPLMQVGQGCRVHLRADELPDGPIIVRLSRHLAAVINGVLFDTHDCSRAGSRCVYGLFRPRAS